MMKFFQTTNFKVMLLLSTLILAFAFLYIIMIPYLGFAALGASHEENHYINISMHLWQQHNWIVLQDDKGLYTNKPPLLFWLVNIFWLVFGVQNWVLRILPAIFV